VAPVRRTPGREQALTVARPELRLSLQMPDPRHRALLPRHRVARWVRAALQAPAEIAVRIVDEEEGLRLNLEFRGQDHATNVLTFDYTHAPLVSADLVLCAPVVEREAQATGIALQDHYAHLLVHGTLHAQGHDHQTASQARAMEALESALMTGLGLSDPWRPRGRPAPQATQPARSRRAASSAK
jgi:probable rRNA maturation factor